MPTILPEDARTEREKVLDDLHNIVRTTHLSRTAVEVSTPEQIVWMTAKAIADNIFTYSREGFDAGHRRFLWYPRENVLAAVIKRELRQTRGLTEKTLATVERAIDRAVEEWPS